MSIITLEEAKAHLNVSGTDDDDLITSHIDAAEAYVDRWLPDDGKLADLDPVPDDLKQAVKMLVAHWYENREATLVGVSAEELSLGFWDILNQFRAWSF